VKQFARPWSSGTFTHDNPGRFFQCRARRWKSVGLGGDTQLCLHGLGSRLQALACYEDTNGEWKAKDVATIGGEGGVLPVDISLSADDKTLFVDCFGDGKCRVYDVSNPHQPRMIYEKQIGRQVNMVSQSWDGKRLYFSSSLLARWDKVATTTSNSSAPMPGMARAQTTICADFAALKLGRPHHMLFGSTKIGN